MWMWLPLPLQAYRPRTRTMVCGIWNQRLWTGNIIEVYWFSPCSRQDWSPGPWATFLHSALRNISQVQRYQPQSSLQLTIVSDRVWSAVDCRRGQGSTGKKRGDQIYGEKPKKWDSCKIELLKSKSWILSSSLFQTYLVHTYAIFSSSNTQIDMGTCII